MRLFRKRPRKPIITRIPGEPWLVIGGLLLALIGIVLFQITLKHPPDKYIPAPELQTEAQNSQTATFDKKSHSLTDPASSWVIVNRQRPLRPDHQPPDLVNPNVLKRTDKPPEELQLRREAAAQLELLFREAQQAGVPLMLGSGFRSYSLQAFYYENYVKTAGQTEADRVSARPGTSEHQAGLAADISGPSGQCYLESCFETQPEAIWLAQHAQDYGFIIRYPKGKEAITGYSYEPWHVRYVGKELAQEISRRQTTLEEFFGVQ